VDGKEMQEEKTCVLHFPFVIFHFSFFICRVEFVSELGVSPQRRKGAKENQFRVQPLGCISRRKELKLEL
jgi:hypothetical protein